MIVTGSRVKGFLKRPDPGVRAVLVYGPDHGLVKERSASLLAAIGGDPADPFSHAELTNDAVRKDPARFADEAALLTFSARRRTVRVRDAGDEIADAVEGWLDSGAGDAFVVIEAGDLGKRSSLRRVIEKSPAAAAIACYADEGESLLSLIAERLAGFGFSADTDALALLADHVGGDRAMVVGELEKLTLYIGVPGRIGVDDVLACIGDSASASLDTIADAACRGDTPRLLQSLDRAFAEGMQAPTIIRWTARHVQRLWLAAGAIAAGEAADKAMDGLKPPVFFKHKESFRRQLRAWSEDRLSAALDILTDAEMACKSTGMPAEALCERALLRLARGAAVADRRTGG